MPESGGRIGQVGVGYSTGVRIAHVPDAHPYVHAVDPTRVRMDDPWSVDSLVGASIDVVHVHFGFEHLDPAELRVWIDRVSAAGIALVHTVHDIDNPHLVDQRPHHLRTGELVRRSQAVVTLTAQAQREIRREWGRTATVVPHPPILSASPSTIDTDGGDGPVLVWMSTLRPNLDLGAIESLAAETHSELDLVVRRSAWDETDAEVRTRIAAMTHRPNVELEIVDRMDDRRLEERIARSSAVVLAYRWGTHSGLVELATDLGVPTVTTPGGCRGGQGALVAPAHALARDVDHVVASRPEVRRRVGSDLQTVRAAHRALHRAARRTLTDPVAASA